MCCPERCGGVFRVFNQMRWAGLISLHGKRCTATERSTWQAFSKGSLDSLKIHLTVSLSVCQFQRTCLILSCERAIIN